ncbi:MAG: penicillin-binding protein 2 [Woeseiaceae bacterium]|jgi:penicillin-binding protein 2|nr:penicillin-binding protein 2 [Woeseiaceae bacterium]
MDLLSPIKDHHSERRLFIARILLSSIIAILLLGTVIARLVQLQVIDHEYFAERSQGNRVRIEPVPPIRGLILDRKGRVLAENFPTYQLELIPEQVRDLDQTLSSLEALGLVDPAVTPEIKAASQRGPRFKPVTLNPRLTDSEIARFAVERPRFPGVDFRPRLVRHYPHGEAVAHAVGYVASLSTDDLEKVEASRYAGTTHGGKTGVEANYEFELHGNAGYRHMVTNARGRQLSTDTSDVLNTLPADMPPGPGDNVYTTLDLDLQRVATAALDGRRGAVVAIDPWSGDILALVSAPAFDPNLFAIGMTPDDYRGLTTNPDKPLFNRAVVGVYPPGSTIKPMLALAALETGATNLTRKTYCRGFFSLPNTTHRYRDWKPEGHGPVDLLDAITQSCDVYFYEIANEIGINNMHDYLEQFGLGQPSGVDLPRESRGLVPSTTWKRERFQGRDPSEQRWYDGETVIASIGQGYMLATPLQLASAAATLATRGVRYQPRLVAAFENPMSGQRRLLDAHEAGRVAIDNEFYWDSVIQAMNDVMQGPRGTARAVGMGAPYTMAGKSGTAQVFSVAQEEEYDEDEIAERLRDHALFIAFAPVENPQIAVAVIVENGSSGSGVAAPIARAIMDQYLGFVDVP